MGITEGHHYGMNKDGVFAGEGKLYDRRGNLCYSGMFADNVMHGYGTEYDNAGNIKYQGEFINGKAQK